MEHVVLDHVLGFGLGELGEKPTTNFKRWLLLSSSIFIKLKQLFIRD